MLTINKTHADQYYISLDGQGWASFIITEKGDLFINSDWGYWACNWRGHGDDFRKFLIDINFEYLMMNMIRQQILFGGKKTLGKRAYEAVGILFAEFQDTLKAGK